MSQGHTPRHSAWYVQAAVAALSISLVLFAGLCSRFHAPSQMPWRAATPDNLARGAVCDGVGGTSAHRACVERGVAAATAAPGDPAVSIDVASRSPVTTELP